VRERADRIVDAYRWPHRVARHVIGTGLLGVAIMRTPWLLSWTGVCVAVSQPPHAVAFDVLGNPTLDLVG
jgi:hypothetical protein